MKKTFLLLVLFLPGWPGQAQQTGDVYAPGSVSAKIYTHFNVGLGQQNPATAFEIKRAYFGYSRDLGEHFSGEVKIDIGSPDDVSEFSLIRRYTYFKNAYLSYQNGSIRVWFGLFDMLQFKLQEDFWGYRYLYRSYLDEYRFGASADLGTGIRYDLLKTFSIDLILSNGEGYKNLQFDNIYKMGIGATLNPVSGLLIRAYYSIHTTSAPQMCLSGFVGYRIEKFRFAGEYIFQRNYRYNTHHNRYGYSVYSTYQFSDKWETFARYDQLYSNILPESEIPWNLANDGSAIISGIQYSPIQNVNISMNYQDWVSYARNGDSQPFLYLNFEIVF